MKVLVVGGGGREHAIAWRIAQDPAVRQVYCVPGNAGAMADVSCIPGNIMDAREMLSLAASLGVDLTVIGPEAPLVEGIADKFRSAGHAVVGPSAAGARLEGSKAFAKDFMAENGIPTARSVLLENLADVERTIGRFGYPVVLKADGLAAGKGVVIAEDEKAAGLTAREMLTGRMVGGAGRRIVVEECLRGVEVSFIVLSDGASFCALHGQFDVLDRGQGNRVEGLARERVYDVHLSRAFDPRSAYVHLHDLTPRGHTHPVNAANLIPMPFGWGDCNRIPLANFLNSVRVPVGAVKPMWIKVILQDE